MATICAWMTAHSAGCTVVGPHEECSDGSEVKHLRVSAAFEPPAGMSLRDRILLARMAVLFSARNGGAEELR